MRNNLSPEEINRIRAARFAKEAAKKKKARNEINQQAQHTYRELLGMAGNSRRHALSTTSSKSILNW